MISQTYIGSYVGSPGLCGGQVVTLGDWTNSQERFCVLELTVHPLYFLWLL